MRNVFILLLLIHSCLFANFSEASIAKALKENSQQAGIDGRILYTIAKIETNFNPLTIAFVSKEHYKPFKNTKTLKQKYKDRFLYSISSNDKDVLIEHARDLIVLKKESVDVGLMQINSINFSLDELDNMFDLNYNIAKSLKVLDICCVKYSNVKEIIECYNKGFRQHKYNDYYTKFKKSFTKDFGGIQ